VLVVCASGVPTVKAAVPLLSWPSTAKTMYCCFPSSSPACVQASKCARVVMEPAVRCVRRTDQNWGKVAVPSMEGFSMRILVQISYSSPSDVTLPSHWIVVSLPVQGLCAPYHSTTYHSTSGLRVHP